jgi:hypothetical protein
MMAESTSITIILRAPPYGRRDFHIKYISGLRSFSPDRFITQRGVIRRRDLLPVAGRGLAAGNGLKLPP